MESKDAGWSKGRGQAPGLEARECALRACGGFVLILVLGFASSANAADLAAWESGKPVQGIPWTGDPGISATVRDILAREVAEPLPFPFRISVKPSLSARDLPRRQDPSAPALAQWPPADDSGPADEVFSPQSTGTSFLAANLVAAGGSVPPDPAGDVGPSQIVVAVNGRIRVFDKSGALGTLDTSLDSFFASVRNGSATSDPRVRYDRLSGRWLVTAINTAQPNRILIAVSSGPTISGASSFAFFQFRHDLVGPTPNSDTGARAESPSLGVDRSALYIGVNVTNGSTAVGSTGFVVNKASLLAGALTVTAFRRLSDLTTTNGPFAPQGVDNDDPAATDGYFIGVDALVFSRLVIRRVTDPGGVPTLSGNLNLAVPNTVFPIRVPHAGVPADRRLDALDDRLSAATIVRDKITGVKSLWAIHAIEVNATGAGATGGGRNGARWYEIRNLNGTPLLHQSGTAYDGSSTSPRFLWMPSLVATGQGHMVLASSAAGSGRFAEVAASGRLSGDPVGSTRPFTSAQSSSTAYLVEPVDGQRWGTRSRTVLDPNDDMTVWTFQEYCDGTNSWGVRAIEIEAPPIPALAGVSPPGVCVGHPSVIVTVTGTAVSGSGFFDPGPDTGGPGFPDRIGASVSGGVAVSSVSFSSPTEVQLNVSTVAATPGAQDVTIRNPDGQTATRVGLLSVFTTTPRPDASNNGPICAGTTLQLFAASIPGATYVWMGPGGFASSIQNPTITGATTAASGLYTVTASVPGCSSAVASTSVEVVLDGADCDDGNECTVGEACLAGVCGGGTPVVCDDGNLCTDDACSPTVGCTFAVDDTNPCEDGSLCTVDRCMAGTCVRNPVVCNDHNPCTDDSCVPSQGCVASPDDTNDCADEDRCTSEACVSGACVSSPVSCEDGNPCTLDRCDPGAGCVFSPLDGNACSDGNACTADSCVDGQCLGSPIRCEDENACTDDGCDPASGCIFAPRTGSCDDGDSCTVNDVCSAGVCRGTPSPVPSEIAGVRLGPPKSALSWTSGDGPGSGTVHDVPRGMLNELPPGSGASEACVASGIEDASTSDPANPPAGRGFWYLVRARNSCGTGTYGFRTLRGVPSSERTTAACP